jgi:hypothetical protein
LQAEGFEETEHYTPWPKYCRRNHGTPELERLDLEIEQSGECDSRPPIVNIILFGKLKKYLDSQINPLFFGDSIKERTYTQHGRSNTA